MQGDTSDDADLISAAGVLIASTGVGAAAIIGTGVDMGGIKGPAPEGPVEKSPKSSPDPKTRSHPEGD